MKTSLHSFAASRFAATMIFVAGLGAYASLQASQRPNPQFPSEPDGREFVVRIEPPGAMTSCQFPNVQRGSIGQFGPAKIRSAVAGVFALPTGFGDKPAKELKLAVWCPGFAIGLLDVQDVESSGYEKTLTLQPLKSIPLAGRVLPPDDGTTLANANLFVLYQALWLCNFFSEQDCGVPQWVISTTADRIAADGSFRILVPDYANDPAIQQWASGPLTNNATGSFYLRAERRDTSPRDYQLGTIQVAAAYPDLRLSAKR